MDFEVFGRVLGVELRLKGDENYSCRVCELGKKGKLLTIEKTEIFEGSLVEVIKSIPRNLPTALVLTGRGIIHKNLKIDQTIEAAKIFASAFPTVNQQDFYVQEVGEGQDFVVSIIRREVVDELIGKLAMAGLKIYIVGLGGLVAIQVLSQLNSYSNKVEFDGHVFDLGADHQMNSYHLAEHSGNEFQLKIGEQPIEAENVVAYASAFQLMLGDKLDMIHARVVAVDEKLAGFLEQSRFKKKGLLVMAILFTALLVNFFVFSYYNEQNSVLSQTVSAQVNNADQTTLLTGHIAENEQLLKQLNWNKGYNYGFLTNEIGSSCPKALQLQAISFNNYKTTAEQSERIPTVKISGVTQNLTAVNNWIFVLKEKTWVKTVKLVSYQQSQETQEYEFSLMITY